MCHAAAKPEGRGCIHGRSPSLRGGTLRPPFMLCPFTARAADTVSQRRAPVTGGREERGTSGTRKTSASRQKRSTASSSRRRASSSAFSAASRSRETARSAFASVPSSASASCSMASARRTRSDVSVSFPLRFSGRLSSAAGFLFLSGPERGLPAGSGLCMESAGARNEADILRTPYRPNRTMTLPSSTASTSPRPHWGMEGLTTMSPTLNSMRYPLFRAFFVFAVGRAVSGSSGQGCFG